MAPIMFLVTCPPHQDWTPYLEKGPKEKRVSFVVSSKRLSEETKEGDSNLPAEAQDEPVRYYEPRSSYSPSSSVSDGEGDVPGASLTSVGDEGEADDERANNVCEYGLPHIEPQREDRRRSSKSSDVDACFERKGKESERCNKEDQLEKGSRRFQRRAAPKVREVEFGRTYWWQAKRS